MTMDNELNPVCKECSCWYPVEYSIHMDYCDECYKEILKTVKKSQNKIKKISVIVIGGEKDESQKRK